MSSASEHLDDGELRGPPGDPERLLRAAGALRAAAASLDRADEAMARGDALLAGLGWRGSAFGAFRAFRAGAGTGTGTGASAPRLDERRHRLADAGDAVSTLAGRLDDLGQRALGLRRRAHDLGLFEPVGAEPVDPAASGPARAELVRSLRREHMALLEDHGGALRAATEALANLEPPPARPTDEPAPARSVSPAPRPPASAPARLTAPGAETVSSPPLYAALGPGGPSVDVVVGRAEMAGEPGWLTGIVPRLEVGVDPGHRLDLLAATLSGTGAEPADGASGTGRADQPRPM